MLKTLFLLIGLFFLVRYIRGLFLPSQKTKRGQFNPFGGINRSSNNSKDKNFDQIEEAEYEDISDKEK